MNENINSKLSLRDLDEKMTSARYKRELKKKQNRQRMLKQRVNYSVFETEENGRVLSFMAVLDRPNPGK